MLRMLPCLLIVAGLLPAIASADDPLQTLGKSSKDTQQAKAVVQKLLSQKDLSLTAVLTAMKSQNDIAKNYYLSVAQAVADREPTQSVEACKQFLTQRDQDSTARYWAFTYVTTYLPTMREKLLDSMIDDPCPELRFDAIELQIKRLETTPPATAEAKQAAYDRLLQLARLPEQVQRVAKLLDESGKKVELLKHFGFLANWNVVGPFDNVGQASFNVAYAPEKEYLENKLAGKLDSLKYDGKEKGLTWKPIETDKPDGKVDLNAAYNNAKGAVVYAVGSFESAKNQTAEIRVGCPNAIKVWVEGKLVIDREVYHAGDQIDQYIAPIQLKAGKNSILVKVCQNEQTEQWAQDWSFQLRISDPTGLAIQSSVASR